MLSQSPDKKWDVKSLPVQENIDFIEITEMNGFGGNYLSRPYYSIDKQKAMIGHYSMKTHGTLFVFKKENMKWVMVSQITNR